MKIKNKLWVLAIILLIGFFVNSCKEDDEPEPITINVDGAEIKIIKMSGVSDGQVDTAVDIIESLLSSWPDGSRSKNDFKSNVTEIRIASSGTAISYTGTILTIPWNVTEDDFVLYLALNDIA